MKLVFTSVYLLSFCTILAFGQNNNTSTTDRRQGRINLDNSIGFGRFIFGSPVTLYKDLKYIPEPDEPSKKYLSKIPVTYNDVRIDSVHLHFIKDKLKGIIMYLNKSQIQNLISYCSKNYGPPSMDSSHNVYEWLGRKKRIGLFETKKDTFEVMFVDISKFEERSDLSDTTVTN